MPIFRALKFGAMSVVLFTLAVSLVAQQQQQVGTNKPFYYSVTDIGTLGGTFSLAYGITDNNWVNGFSTLAGDGSQHAFIWKNGTITDLGTLGGPNSQAYGRMNNRGEVPGYSDTTVPNPLGEDNCYFGTYLICSPFVWRNGVMTQLRTLGGYNAWALENNNSGQIVGTAENTTPDPNCLPPQVLQFRPVIWEKEQIRELPIYAGDSQGAAYSINEKGQVAGISGNCFTSPAGFFDLWRHPLLWEGGKMTYLGSFGGVRNNVANQINNKGQIVGTSDLPGDAIRHACLWERSQGHGNGTMTDLGTLAGDVSSEGWSINNKGDIVGASCDAENNCR